VPVLQRESDVQRFAALASDYVRSGDAARLAPEINAYYASYGDSVLVVSPCAGRLVRST
jgi:hypothetical protein